jgi:hypothetical protein
MDGAPYRLGRTFGFKELRQEVLRRIVELADAGVA